MQACHAPSDRDDLDATRIAKLPAPFEDASWYRALTLKERLAALRAAAPPVITTPNTPSTEHRHQPWRDQPPFANPTIWTARLAADGMTDAAFERLVNEPIACVRDRVPAPPEWLTDLAAAFSQPFSAVPLPLPEHFHTHPMAGLLHAAQPLLGQGLERLRAGIADLLRRYPHVPFDPATIEEILLAGLPDRVIRMMGRTAALEVNVLRLQGLLAGDTPEARFRHFTERLRQPEHALALWQEYPVLARQVVNCIRQWVTNSLELLARLGADWPRLRQMFSSATDPGPLTHLGSEAGDRHQDGRTVAVLEFRSGLRLVYKPRAMALAVQFQALLAWINASRPNLPFRTTQILDCGTYGWMEFITASPCESPQEVERFYQRQGGYLALLYAIEATDFHLENLIAAGEHPVLIDLETLFHPRVPGEQSFLNDDPAAEAAWHSVIHVGLLPVRLMPSEESDGVDLSGLGGAPGQLTSVPVPVWEQEGTDEMALDRRRVPVKVSHNRPSLAGAEVDLADYTEALVAGFTTVYRLLMEQRAQLLSPDGLLTRFADAELRAVLRSTRVYSFLLAESFHPDLLRDALDRDRLFDRLWLVAEHHPGLTPVIPAERRALDNGDIPFFTARAHGTDLWASATDHIDPFFSESGLAAAERRLQQFSEQDLERQVWIIRASLASLEEWPRQQHPHARVRLGAGRQVCPSELLAEAGCIGNRIERLALRGPQEVNWLGLAMTSERHGEVAPLDLDLYDGMPGVALFLAYLGALSGVERYTDLAQAACTTMLRTVQNNRDYLTWIGGFVGWGGILYTLTHLAALWRQPQLLDEAQQIVELLPALIDQDEHLDVLSGAAGCIVALLRLHEARPCQRTLAAAIQCGDRLIARAQPAGDGLCWPVRVLGPLAGFSHGAAGIAWALLALFARTGEERFRTAARGGITYEHSLFSAEAGNWRDLRDPEHMYFPTVWCHGAPGIGLARLAAVPLLQDDGGIRADIATALQTTLTTGFGFSHSLCHGDLGNLELLLQSDEPSWRDTANRLAGTILDSARQHGWRCGTPMGVESPGLMTGLAGIGYGLLRLAAPARVPSVLTLEGPRDAQEDLWS
jgi:type 2 lantibiotic biosynthesis protein LanM